MEVTTKCISVCSPEELAKALAQSTPEEFAAFWFKFSEVCTDVHLDLCAKLMAENLGANRNIILKRMVDRITYYEIDKQKAEGKE